MYRSVPEKANFTLRMIGIVLVLVAIRVWYLATIAHDEHVEMAERPRRRQVTLLPERGTISDRFGEPLALNKIRYNAAILYDEIREIPYVRWVKSGRKRAKTYPRKEYVTKLATLMGEELAIEPQFIEDMIYSRASLFPNTPFTIKEDISEESFYRLSALTKEFPGISVQIGSKRVYPNGKLGCDIIGYLGAINQNHYRRIGEEMSRLRDFLAARDDGLAPPLPKGFNSVADVVKRLQDLQEKAYTLNSQVGKGGVEGFFDEKLRGALGKSFFEVDMQGHILRELDGGFPSTNGEGLKLALSAELQDYAEKLLSFSEAAREENFESSGKGLNQVPSPWIKGGAIVAMIPQTGEVVALASYPRFDPNDFIGKNPAIGKWLESPTYFGDIWDGKRLLERELFSLTKNCYYKEEELLTWSAYLDRIFVKNSPIKEVIKSIETLEAAISLLRDPLEFFENKEEDALFHDLLALVVDEERFDEELMKEAALLSLDDYRALCQAKASLMSELKKQAQDHFHRLDFQKWREEHFTTYLKKKRIKEKKEKKVNKPYLDYLEAKERKLFRTFWVESKDHFLFSLIFHEPLPQNLTPYQSLLENYVSAYPAYLEKLRSGVSKELIHTMRSYAELNKPLRMRYRHLKNREPTFKDLATAFSPHHYGYLSSEAFNQATPQGSIFKVVTALEALRQHHKKNPTSLNPLTLIDDYQPHSKTPTGAILGFLTNGEKITRRYKGGTLPRSHPYVGQIDIKTAMERSSNIYFSLLTSDHMEHPLDIIRASKELGFGKRTGIDLPGEYRGLLPTDLRENRTGLYSLAIGQHSLVVTPLQTAIMFSAIANGGAVLKPQILCTPPYEERRLDIPKEVQKTIIDSLFLVVNGQKGSARPSRIRLLHEHPPFLRNYLKIRKSLVGKTSTAEINYRPTLDPAIPPIKAKHTWFGGISFKDETLEEPELVVIVYLKFSSSGKEAAPYASEIINKWRQITKK